MKLRTRAALGAACAVLLALAAAPTASADWHSCPNWDIQPSQATLTQSVVATMCILNDQRRQHGLRPLRWNWRLWGVGQRITQDMVTQQFFSHDEPNGKGLRARLSVSGYVPKNGMWSAGENLAYGQTVIGTPAAIVFGWMTSPGHRANILDPDFRDIGIGASIGAPVPGHGDGLVLAAEFGYAVPF